MIIPFFWELKPLVLAGTRTNSRLLDGELISHNGRLGEPLEALKDRPREILR